MILSWNAPSGSSSILSWSWYFQTTMASKRWNPGIFWWILSPNIKRLNSTRTERNTTPKPNQRGKKTHMHKKKRTKKTRKHTEPGFPYWASVVCCSHDHTPEWHVGPDGWVEAPTASAWFGRGWFWWKFAAGIIPPPQSLTLNLKIMVSNRNLLVQGLIFRI